MRSLNYYSVEELLTDEKCAARDRVRDRHSVIRHFMNIESVYPYEGTHDIHTLVVGQDITGLNALAAD